MAYLMIDYTAYIIPDDGYAGLPITSIETPECETEAYRELLDEDQTPAHHYILLKQAPGDTWQMDSILLAKWTLFFYETPSPHQTKRKPYR